MLDSLGLAAIADEIAGRLPARVQDVMLVDPGTLHLELYARGESTALRATVRPDAPGIWITGNRARRAPTPTPFGLVARKWLTGALLETAVALSDERILHLTFACRPREIAPRSITLIVEATGRLANLILVDEVGRIIDAAKRVPRRINSVRQILPHLVYVAPPPQDKLSPRQLDPVQIGATLRDATSDSLDRALIDAIRGIGPITAREIAFRATGNIATAPCDAAPERVADAVAELLAPLRRAAQWAPCFAEAAGRAGATAAPFLLTHRHAGALPSMSAAVEAALSALTPPERTLTHSVGESHRSRVLHQIERLHARARALERELATADSGEDARREGQLLLTHAAAVPAGVSEIELEGVRLHLDPRLGAAQNAQACFARYRHAKQTRETLRPLIQRARSEIAALQEAAVHLVIARDAETAHAIADELISQGLLPGEVTPVRRTPRARPYLKFERGAYECLVGRSGIENRGLTFREARPRDLWLHARGVVGAHVILRGPTGPDDDALLWAAAIAAAHSEAHEELRVSVDVTERRHVRSIPGAPGAVSYTHERVLEVRPQAALPTLGESRRSSARTSTRPPSN
ncbi:MAG: fibronectin/fibrinogen-binding protein [Chloroflexi bacterium]|nr:fibronectin/fibrinogen-binding protein [Chloroflexota bacterium]